MESGLSTFVNWNKDFIGKRASLKAKENDLKQKLVTLMIETDGIDVSNDEAIMHDGLAVGYVSSGGYGHRIKKSIAMGYVKTEALTPGARFQVEILGKYYDAQILDSVLYDATGANFRA